MGRAWGVEGINQRLMEDAVTVARNASELTVERSFQVPKLALNMLQMLHLFLVPPSTHPSPDPSPDYSRLDTDRTQKQSRFTAKPRGLTGSHTPAWVAATVC